MQNELKAKMFAMECLQNGAKFIEDALILIENKSCAHAAGLCSLSIEECSKAFFADMHRKESFWENGKLPAPFSSHSEKIKMARFLNKIDTVLKKKIVNENETISIEEYRIRIDSLIEKEDPKLKEMLLEDFLVENSHNLRLKSFYVGLESGKIKTPKKEIDENYAKAMLSKAINIFHIISKEVLYDEYLENETTN